MKKAKTESKKNYNEFLWGKRDNNEFSSHWMEQNIFGTKRSYFDRDSSDLVKKEFDLIQLAKYQTAIGNFVKIMTNDPDIKVKYAEDGAGSAWDRSTKTVTLSSKINSDSFDAAVGEALHEASHFMYTEKDTMNLYIEKRQYLSGKLACSDREEKLFKTLVNFVEDLYVDSKSYESAVGYRGYYSALYRNYYDVPEITENFLNPEYCIPSYDNYEFHIVNGRHPDHDDTVLPDLDKISNLLDVSKISSLSLQMQRCRLAKEIFDIVIENIKKQDNQPEDQQDNQDDSSDGKIYESNEPYANLIDFINGVQYKETLNSKTQEYVDAYCSVDIKLQDTSDKEFGIPNIPVIVIKKLTESFIDSSGMNYGLKRRNADLTSTKSMIDTSIRLGKLFAKKIMLRNEDCALTTTRLNSGKVDKRLLHEIGFDNYDIFKKINITSYTPAYIHLSIDQSGSMSGDNIINAVKFATLLATASTIINNLHVVVTIRSSHSNDSNPYIIYLFDSNTDNINTIRNIFGTVVANDSTPEGIVFETIMKDILNSSVNCDSHFINICDGQPAYSYRASQFSYSGHLAQEHCKKQMQLMERNGIKFTAYSIGDSDTFRLVTRSYGKNTIHIREASEINKIATTLNKVLLDKK